MQASRISTFLHMNGMPGENSEQAPRRCPSPCTTFFSPGNGRAPASWVHPSPKGKGQQSVSFTEEPAGHRYQLSERAQPRQEGSPFLRTPGGGDQGWRGRGVSCLLPWSVAWYLLILKDLQGQVSSSPLLFLCPRCEFSLGPGPLPSRGSGTPGLPLHHQLYAGRAYHPHTHLHRLLHDSRTAPGTDWQGPGGRAALQGGEGWPLRHSVSPGLDGG